MLHPFHVYVDRGLHLVKWPAAAACVLLAWPAAATLWETATLLWRHPRFGLALLAGLCVFAIPLFLRKNRPALGFWATLEHEFTHIVFALLTLHPIHALQASEGSGGVVSYRGNGNWLVSIAPYFFPTFPLLVGVLMLTLPATFKLFGVGCMGFALAWHLRVTWAEMHSGQSDLRDVGFTFCTLFLPGASLLCLGLVLALVHKGAGGPTWYGARLWVNLVKASDALTWLQKI